MSAPTDNTTKYVNGIPVTRAAADDEIIEAHELTAEEQFAADYEQEQAQEEHERQQLEAVAKKSKTKKRTSPQVEIDTSVVDHVDDSNKDAMTRRVTTGFCARIKAMGADERPPITEAGDQLVRIMDAYGSMWAQKRGDKHYGASLSPRQVADLVHTYHDIVLVAVDAERSRDNALMHLYNEAEGVWDIITDRVSGLIDLAADLVYGVDTRFLNEYEHHVRLAAEIKEAPDNPHDIFFPNGIYNYQSDEMREHTREDMSPQSCRCACSMSTISTCLCVTTAVAFLTARTRITAWSSTVVCGPSKRPWSTGSAITPRPGGRCSAP